VDDWEPTGGSAPTAAESGSNGDGSIGADQEVRLVPMRVGDAEVYVEAVGPPPDVLLSTDDEWEPVGGLNPADAFEKASDALKECVNIVGDRLNNLGQAIEPDEIGVEYTITFDVEGEAKIIPVLLTGKAKTAMGVKVSALWRPRERSNGGGQAQDGAR
jgi:hypothetical protein